MSAEKVISRDHALQIYRKLRSLEGSDIQVEGLSKDRVSLIKKIAQNTDQDEFADLVINQEIPAIKLSIKEMETVRGGISRDIMYLSAQWQGTWD